MQCRSKYNRIETELIKTSGVVKKTEVPFNGKKMVSAKFPSDKILHTSFLHTKCNIEV